MKIFKSVAAWRRFRARGAFKGRTLGFVPTMGALHEGHLSLLRRAKKENDAVVASIFVNPAQFDDKKDLARYPRAAAADIAKLNRANTDFLLLPESDSIYPDGYRYRVTETVESRARCGKFRPGHFEGMLTVVMKLLNIIGADKAYFGEKDYQQYMLVKEMAAAFFLSTEIVPCPSVREPDGLAMSSRNSLLDAGQRKLAPCFYRLLSSGGTPVRIARKLSDCGLEPEYVEERWGRRFGAVKLGRTRLIDNVKI